MQKCNKKKLIIESINKTKYIVLHIRNVVF